MEASNNLDDVIEQRNIVKTIQKKKISKLSSFMSFIVFQVQK